MYYLIDLFIKNITNINISFLLFYIHKINLKQFILNLLIVFILTQNHILFIQLILIYMLNKIILKYLNIKLLSILLLYNINYFVIIKYSFQSYLINLILVIILYYFEYKLIGEKDGIKKVLNRFI